MKLLVFGRNGQVARELALIAPDALYLGREEVDVAQPANAGAAIRLHRPEVIINAAAYTAVDGAESEEALATKINAEAPAQMARAAADIGAVFVHISSDYVFDGEGERPFAPDAAIAPLGAYGRSKALGEAPIRAAGCTYAILRTSWVFSAHGTNFVKTMLRLGRERDQLGVVADQHGGPTPAAAIASACLTIAQELQLNPALSGTYHFSGAPDTSWHGFAAEIFAQSGLHPQLNAIASSAFPTPAKRPHNSRLDCTSLYEAFGIERPDWRSALNDVLTHLKNREG